MAGLLTDYAAQVQDLKRRGVVEIFAAEAPLLQVLSFIDLQEEFGYDYNVEASLGGIAFRAVGEPYSGTALGVGVVNPRHEGTAICGGMVPLDRQYANNAAYKASKIAMKTKAAARFLVKNIIEGSTVITPKGFDGLYKRLTGDNVVYAGANGDQLDLDVLSERIDRVPGEASQKRLLMGAAMRRTLGATIRSQGATQMGRTEWEGELKPRSYDGVSIVIIGEDESGAEIMDFDETRGNSAVTGSILTVRFGGQTDEEYVQGLARRAAVQGVFEVEDQGRANATDNTLVEGRIGLAIFHPKAANRYAGILTFAAA